MTTTSTSQATRSPLAIVLTVLVALSLLTAAFFLAQGFPSDEATETQVTIPIPSIPGIGPGETGEPTGEGELVITIPTPVTADDLRELALALAAVITAVTGLFGIVATQVWRRREESRTDKTHALALERERLELERERLQLERDRLELERQREALLGKS